MSCQRLILFPRRPRAEPVHIRRVPRTPTMRAPRCGESILPARGRTGRTRTPAAPPRRRGRRRRRDRRRRARDRVEPQLEARRANGATDTTWSLNECVGLAVVLDPTPRAGRAVRQAVAADQRRPSRRQRRAGRGRRSRSPSSARACADPPGCGASRLPGRPAAARRPPRAWPSSAHRRSAPRADKRGEHLVLQGLSADRSVAFRWCCGGSDAEQARPDTASPRPSSWSLMELPFPAARSGRMVGGVSQGHLHLDASRPSAAIAERGGEPDGRRGVSA